MATLSSRPSRFVAVIFYLSIGYIALLAISFLVSLTLPSFPERAPMFFGLFGDTNCYWTDAMLVFVDCAPAGAFSSILGNFFNLWLFLLYAPMFTTYAVSQNQLLFVSLSATVALYLPIVIFVVLLIRKLAGKFRN